MAKRFPNKLNDVKLNKMLTFLGKFGRDLLDGSILMRKSIRNQYRLIVLAVIFCLFYIGNRYACDKAAYDKYKLEKKIEGLRYQEREIRAKYTELTRNSVIEETVKNTLPYLDVLREPVVIINQDKR
ncbi:MAG: hypothetical protein LBR81_00105 [Prevotellaceae bacterium]|jgi:hypothetical protein|nr:hypothetical protein [Prevotellaceae bacterium]